MGALYDSAIYDTAQYDSEGVSVFNYASGSAPTVRIGTSDRPDGESAAGYTNGFIVYNTTNGKKFTVAGGVWVESVEAVPVGLLADWRSS